MSNEPTDIVYVDPATDNLDDFSQLLSGKAQPKPAEDPVEDVNETDDNEPDNTEAVEQTDDTPDEDVQETDEDSQEDKPKKVNRFQERINELTAKAREAERREAELNRKLEELAQKQSEAAKQPTVQTEAADNAPHPDAKNEDGSEKYPLGEFDPAYIRDLTRHTIQEEQRIAREQEAQQRAAQEEQEARNILQEQWSSRLAPATEKYDDFLDKTLQLESAFDGLDPQYSDYLVNTIKSLDHGPDVLYYFANNLDEAHKFVKMGPLHATLALGEINAMFKGQTRKETKVSKAPPPPQVNKGTQTRVAIAPDTDDLDAFSKVFFAKK